MLKIEAELQNACTLLCVCWMCVWLAPDWMLAWSQVGEVSVTKLSVEIYSTDLNIYEHMLVI